MLRFFAKLIGRRCDLCNGKINRGHLNYYDDKGKKIKVCLLCVEYAERRAYRK